MFQSQDFHLVGTTFFTGSLEGFTSSSSLLFFWWVYYTQIAQCPDDDIHSTALWLLFILLFTQLNTDDSVRYLCFWLTFAKELPTKPSEHDNSRISKYCCVLGHHLELHWNFQHQGNHSVNGTYFTAFKNDKLLNSHESESAEGSIMMYPQTWKYISLVSSAGNFNKKYLN